MSFDPFHMTHSPQIGNASELGGIMIFDPRFPNGLQSVVYYNAQFLLLARGRHV